MQGLEEALCAKHGDCIHPLRHVDVTTSIAEADTRKITPSDFVSSRSHVASPWSQTSTGFVVRKTPIFVCHSFEGTLRSSFHICMNDGRGSVNSG
jgi:hypothetical protein